MREGMTMSRPATAHPPGSYEDFVTARSQALYRSAYLMTGQAHDAEDLVQATLVKLYVAWKRASRADSVEAYARRVMVNTFISQRRTKRWLKERVVESLPEQPWVDDGPEEHLTLWPLVSGLPPRQRAVVVLRYYEQLSEAEIADALGVSPGTVKSTASAALKSLRKQVPTTTDSRVEEDR